MCFLLKSSNLTSDKCEKLTMKEPIGDLCIFILKSCRALMLSALCLGGVADIESEDFLKKTLRITQQIIVCAILFKFVSFFHSTKVDFEKSSLNKSD